MMRDASQRTQPTLPPPPAEETASNLRAKATELEAEIAKLQARAKEFRLAALRLDCRGRATK